MKIAAFDLGSNMAVAHNIYGTDDVRVSHQHFKGTRLERGAATYLWLRDLFAQFEAAGVEAIIYERPFARGQDATRSLWGLAGLLDALGTAAGLPVLDASPSEIKLHAGGKGSATKEDMILYASLSGYAGENEHEADAWCLLRFAEATLEIEPAKEKKVGRPRDKH